MRYLLQDMLINIVKQNLGIFMSKLIEFSTKTINDYANEIGVAKFPSYSLSKENEVNTYTYEDTLAENEQMLKESMPNKILFSIEESAGILGVSYDYIRNLVSSGQIASKQFGKRKLIHIKELARLITEGVN
ncbi:MAG: helix-turn-helix domain-containing protein [Melioribacteraceae bacterium]|nr:MAG: helix-turn-helix domain-containing protein [Melioribacteraceae bacterium]